MYDSDSDTWTGTVEEFPGCIVQSSHATSCTISLRYAMEDWVADALDLGQEIPEPRKEVG